MNTQKSESFRSCTKHAIELPFRYTNFHVFVIFVSNPDMELRKSYDEAIFGETRDMVRDFSELLDTITESAESPPGIVPDEADAIREKWEDLKACVERFVIACEKGVYHPMKKK